MAILQRALTFRILWAPDAGADQGKHVEDRITENNKYFYKAMGPGVVIPPWNFAFAIVCGTVAAPIVAGNPVLLKPSENTPVIAYKLVEVLEEAGLPKGVLNFVPGDQRKLAIIW